MQIGLSTRQVSTAQQALSLLNKARETAEAPAALESSGGTPKSWNATPFANTVSGRAIATIQQLVQGQGSATTTFKIVGGGEKTVPTDEYEFAAKTSFQTIEEVQAYFLANETERRKQLLTSAVVNGLTDHVPQFRAELESWERSVANGTAKVELLDDRVRGHYNYVATRWPDGSIAAINAEKGEPFDWAAFNQVYGDGKGGYDRNYLVSETGSYFIRAYVISWEK